MNTNVRVRVSTVSADFLHLAPWQTVYRNQCENKAGFTVSKWREEKMM